MVCVTFAYLRRALSALLDELKHLGGAFLHCALSNLPALNSRRRGGRVKRESSTRKGSLLTSGS